VVGLVTLWFGVEHAVLGRQPRRSQHQRHTDVYFWLRHLAGAFSIRTRGRTGDSVLAQEKRTPCSRPTSDPLRLMDPARSTSALVDGSLSKFLHRQKYA